MNWITWVLPILIALPLIGGVLAGTITNDRTRNLLVTLLALLIAAGGIAVVGAGIRVASGETVPAGAMISEE